MRITKVTTKTGDTGQTSLGSGERVKKTHPRINLLGELDHFNSVIGWTMTSFSDNNIIKELKNIQQDIYLSYQKYELPNQKPNYYKRIH